MRNWTLSLALICCSHPLRAAEPAAEQIEKTLQTISSVVAGAPGVAESVTADALKNAIATDLRERRRQVNQNDVAAWRGLKSKADWEQMRRQRLDALRKSLGEFPAPPDDLRVQVTRRHNGDGFVIECLTFESRPGLVVTANLYRPADPPPKTPGILICHSHHNPKTQSELQDMGVIWARAGCLVLVMDQLGHGERRQHPFRSSADFPGSFRVSRQDYYFRYNVGIQLHLVGDSLIGWMAWDLMRGVDLLLAQDGIDPRRILLLGAVAGGGDPCAVTAAIDPRITAAVPFNFGGPQPENRFPLPKDTELNFNYVGGGSWESTRNLKESTPGGFLPWVIVGSIAPRPLIYAHEFRWDKEHDPVWRRLQQIYGWYDVSENLASLRGYGGVQLSSKEASHCNNIGSHHRKQVHPQFEKWFGISVSLPEHRARRDSAELHCVTPSSRQLSPLTKLLPQLAERRIDTMRAKLQQQPTTARADDLRRAWDSVLHVLPVQPAQHAPIRFEDRDGFRMSKLFFRVDTFSIPALILAPRRDDALPCVVLVGQQGKAEFLKGRRAEVARLLAAGVAVCLVDLPGCGEMSPADYRGRRSSATGISSGLLMLGRPVVGSRLRELLAIIQALRKSALVDGSRIAVWGDSLAEPNSPQTPIAVPWGADGEPEQSEPLGAFLGLLASVFDPHLKAVAVRNGLVSFRSVLESQFVYLPHDIVVPDALQNGDLADLAFASGIPTRVEGLVDGVNRPATADAVKREWSIARSERVHVHRSPRSDLSQWLIDALRAR